MSLLEQLTPERWETISGAIGTVIFIISTIYTKLTTAPTPQEGLKGLLKTAAQRIGAGDFKDAEDNWSIPGLGSSK